MLGWNFVAMSSYDGSDVINSKLFKSDFCLSVREF
jgi:hypothetical protein